MALFVKLQVALPTSRTPQVVAVRPNVTLEEAVDIIAEKYGSKECKGKQLVIAPKSKKKGGHVFSKTAIVSHTAVTEKDVLELWQDPRMVKVGPFDGKGPHLLALDFGCPLKEMIPLLKKIFYKKHNTDIAVLCVIDTKQRFWLTCNLSLHAQEVGHDYRLILFPMQSLLGMGLPYFSPPQKQGYLSITELPKSVKVSTKKPAVTGSKKYWFVLKQPHLIYWTNEKKAGTKAAKGVLSLDRFTIRRVDSKGPIYPYLLHKWPLSVDEKLKKEEEESYYLAAESNAEMKGWVDAIQPMCINCEPTRVFGVPIQTLAMRNNGDNVPPVLRKTVNYITAKGLDVEGIFRVCGSSQDIEAYKQKFDDGEDVDIDSCSDVHIVCGLLKLFLREMPEPILTFELYDCFIAAHANMRQFAPDPSVVAAKMVELLSGLPTENFEVLKYVLKFLSLVEQHSNRNLMTLENLATVFGPNLLRQSNEETRDVFGDSAFISEICETLISQQSVIFEQVDEKKENVLRLSRSRGLQDSGESTQPIAESSVPKLSLSGSGESKSASQDKFITPATPRSSKSQTEEEKSGGGPSPRKSPRAQTEGNTAEDKGDKVLKKKSSSLKRKKKKEKEQQGKENETLMSPRGKKEEKEERREKGSARGRRRSDSDEQRQDSSSEDTTITKEETTEGKEEKKASPRHV